MEDVGFPEGLYTKLLQGFLLQFVLESFVCYFCTFFFQGTRQWLELRKVGRWSQFQCATCTRDVARKHHSCRKEKQQGNMNNWKCWCVSYDLRLLKFGPTSTTPGSHEWPDILSGDNRYRSRSRYALCFAALFDDTLGAHLGAPFSRRICWFTKLRWLRKPHGSCEAWATLPICWTSKSRQQKLFLSKKRINTCKGWKDLFCTWIWFQSRNFKSLVYLAGHECFCLFLKRGSEPSLGAW